jgi:uncharacterized protein (DUF1697 family)
MTTFIALLRAVNVGGTGKLPMSRLTAMCEAAGFVGVRTYIASGNVVFQSSTSEKEVKMALEASLAAYAGRAVGVMVRTIGEMLAVLEANPFPNAARNRTIAIFLDGPPPKDTLGCIGGRTVEEIRLGTREIYVHYGATMVDSRLRIAAARTGTARNMNTVARLAAMALRAAGN